MFADGPFAVPFMPSRGVVRSPATPTERTVAMKLGKTREFTAFVPLLAGAPLVFLHRTWGCCLVGP